MATNYNTIPSIPSSQKQEDLLNAPVENMVAKDENPGVVTTSNVQSLPKGLGEPTGLTNAQPTASVTPNAIGQPSAPSALAKTTTPAGIGESAAQPGKAMVRTAVTPTPEVAAQAEAKDKEKAAAKVVEDAKAKEDEMALAKKNSLVTKTVVTKPVDNKIPLEEQGLLKTLDEIYAAPQDQLEKNRDIAIHLNVVAQNKARIASEAALYQHLAEQNMTGNGIGNAYTKSLYVSNQSLLANTNNLITMDWLNKSTDLLTKKTDAIAQQAINQQIASDNQVNNMFNAATSEEKILIAKSLPGFSPLFDRLANDAEFQKEFLNMSDPVSLANQNAAANRITALTANKTMTPKEMLATGKNDYIASVGGPITAQGLTDTFFDVNNPESSYGNLVSVLGQAEADNILNELNSGTMTPEDKINYYIEYSLKNRQINADKELIKDSLPTTDKTLIDTDYETNIRENLNNWFSATTAAGGGNLKMVVDGQNISMYQNGTLITDMSQVPQLSIFVKDWEGKDFKPGHLHDAAYNAVYKPLDTAWINYQKGLDPKITDNDRAKFKTLFFDNLSIAEQVSSMGQYGRLTPGGETIKLTDYIKQQNASGKQNENIYNVDAITGTKEYVPGITPPTPIEKPKTNTSGVPTDVSQLPEEIGLSQARGQSQAAIKDYHPNLSEQNSPYNLSDYLDNPTSNQFLSYKKTDSDTNPSVVKKVPEISYEIGNNGVIMNVSWNLIDPDTGNKVATINSKAHKYTLDEADAIVQKFDKSGIKPKITESFSDTFEGAGAFTKGAKTKASTYSNIVRSKYPKLWGPISVSPGSNMSTNRQSTSGLTQEEINAINASNFGTRK